MGVLGEACVGFVCGVGGDQPEPRRLGVGQDLDPLDHEAGAVPQHRHLAGAGGAAGHVDQQPVAVGNERLHRIAPRAQDAEVAGLGVALVTDHALGQVPARFLGGEFLACRPRSGGGLDRHLGDGGKRRAGKSSRRGAPLALLRFSPRRLGGAQLARIAA